MQLIEYKQAIVCVIGPHAGEENSIFFQRKINDIEKVGKTYWLTKSRQIYPEIVKQLCVTNTDNRQTFLLFISPATEGGAKPTKLSITAKEFSADGEMWHPLDKNLSPVTGKIDRATYAFVLDRLELFKEAIFIDLWHYNDYINQQNVKLTLGSSTACIVRSEGLRQEGIKSRYRQVFGLGRLVDPYCGWLR